MLCVSSCLITVIAVFSVKSVSVPNLTSCKLQKIIKQQLTTQAQTGKSKSYETSKITICGFARELFPLFSKIKEPLQSLCTALLGFIFGRDSWAFRQFFENLLSTIKIIHQVRRLFHHFQVIMYISVKQYLQITMTCYFLDCLYIHSCLI